MNKGLKQAITTYASDNDITLDAIASSLGIGRSTLYDWMNNSHHMYLDDAFRLSRLLGCTLDELCAMRGIK